MEFRQAFYKTLKELMLKDERICVLDADLAKPNGTYPLYKEFPDRCYNVGIAEANMISIAAGLSSYGFIPFIFTFAPFATRRACDQIAVSLAYSMQRAIIVGTDPGITAENNGGTHMAFEDISVMRAIPRVMIYDAVDAYQLSQAIPQLLNYDGVVYIRMPRKLYPDVYEEGYKFTLGKSDVLKTGNDLTLFTSGIMASEALKVIPILEEHGIDVELISLNTLKPLDEETIINSVNKTNKAVVYENHSVIGGAFSAVSELLSCKRPTLLKAIGIKDEFGQTGKYKELLEEYKIDAASVAKEIIDFINNIK